MVVGSRRIYARTFLSRARKVSMMQPKLLPNVITYFIRWFIRSLRLFLNVCNFNALAILFVHVQFTYISHSSIVLLRLVFFM